MIQTMARKDMEGPKTEKDIKKAVRGRGIKERWDFILASKKKPLSQRSGIVSLIERTGSP